MTEAHRHLLADGDHRTRLDLCAFQVLQRFDPVALAQGGFEFEGDVEMFDQSGFTAPGDHAKLVDAGSARFLDCILDQGLIDDWQHLLGQRLGGG